jgi:hypothetical protein
MDWTRVVSGEKVKAAHINDIQQALDGTAGKGRVMSFTEVDDAARYALSVKNKDATNSLIARFLNAAGAVVLGVVKEAVNVSKQIVSTVADGTAPFVVTSTTVVPNLNADTVDGVHGGSGAGQLLTLDGDGYVPLANLKNRTRKFFLTGHHSNSYGYGTYGWPLRHTAANDAVVVTFVVPSDFVSDLSLTVWLLGSTDAADGDVYLSTTAVIWDMAETDNEERTTVGPTASALATVASTWSSRTVNLTGVAAGNLVRFTALRDGTNEDDTLNESASVPGILVSYTADM